MTQDNNLTLFQQVAAKYAQSSSAETEPAHPLLQKTAERYANSGGVEAALAKAEEILATPHVDGNDGLSMLRQNIADMVAKARPAAPVPQQVAELDYSF